MRELRRRTKILTAVTAILAAALVAAIVLLLLPRAESSSASTTASVPSAISQPLIYARDEEPSVSSVADAAAACNVYVVAAKGTTKSEGSGVCVSQDGYIITNAHIVSGFDSISIKLSDGISRSAKVVFANTGNDIALLKANCNCAAYAPIGDSSLASIGSTVIIAGNPGGKKFPDSICSGIISNTARDISIDNKSSVTAIQCDASVNPGNSGGAMWSSSGEFIAMVAARYDTDNFVGVAFGIPSNLIVSEIAKNTDLKKFAAGGILDITYRYLDPTTAENSGNPSGCLVETSALKAIESGDIIMSVDGKYITNTASLSDITAGKQAGADVDVALYRGGKIIEKTVSLTER